MRSFFRQAMRARTTHKVLFLAQYLIEKNEIKNKKKLFSLENYNWSQEKTIESHDSFECSH